MAAAALRRCRSLSLAPGYSKVFRVVTALDKSELLGRVDALKQALAVLPPTEPLQKALYHCERLHIALRTSHQEGTRFAAFTVKRIIVAQASTLPPMIPALMQEIIGALEANGLDLQK